MRKPVPKGASWALEEEFEAATVSVCTACPELVPTLPAITAESPKPTHDASSAVDIWSRVLPWADVQPHCVKSESRENSVSPLTLSSSTHRISSIASAAVSPSCSAPKATPSSTDSIDVVESIESVYSSSTKKTYSSPLSAVSLASFPETPCPRRRRSPIVLIPSGSHSSRKEPITRPAWLKTHDGGATTHRSCKTDNVLSLKHLADIEKEPTHTWQLPERVVLCCLFRFYQLSPCDLTNLFNSVTGLSLRLSKLRAQFNRGGPAFQDMRKAFYATPFNDPNGTFRPILAIINNAAAESDIDLRPRKVESTHAYEKFAKPDPRAWRRYFVKVLDKESSAAEIRQRTHIREQVEQDMASLELSSLNLDDDYVFVDSEEVSPPSSPQSRLAFPGGPAESWALGYRTWDESSMTEFGRYGFRCSSCLYRTDGRLPEPIKGDPVLVEMLANNHCSFQGGAGSAFVSVFSGFSMLQMLVCSAKKKNPRIALIDLKSTELTGRKHDSAEIAKALRTHNQLDYTRYKYTGECMVFGGVPLPAIINVPFYYDNLQKLAWSDRDVGQLLNPLFDVVTPTSRTSTIAKKLEARRLVLNQQTAKGMGKIGALFGLGGPRISAEHITEFVAAIIRGWTLRKGSLDMHSLGTLAQCFATTLGAQMHCQTVMSAFIAGTTRKDNGNHG